MLNSTSTHNITTGDQFYDNITIDELLPQDVFGGDGEEMIYEPYVYDGEETIFLTRYGQIIPTISGSISLASSTLIIYIILRSHSKLSSPYHIIMFSLSLADIIASTAMAFSTVPMPKDVIYPFEGATLGSTSTCELQGFVYLLGVSLVLCSNISLNIFYLCTIRYGMSEQNVKRYLLPFLFACSLAASLPLPMMVKKRKMFNPSPHDSFCAIYTYPHGCFDPENDHIECIRGAEGCSNFVQRVGTWVIGSGLVILVLSMILILRTVYLVERYSAARNRRASNGGSGGSRSDAVELVSQDSPSSSPASGTGVTPVADRNWDTLELTRTILLQAVLYVVAFLLSWLPTLIVTMGPLSDFGDIVRLIFQPLQGFFSAIIFVYHKAHNLHRADDLTMWQAVWKVIVSPSRAPEVMIARVSMVIEDEFNERRLPVETFWGTRIVHEPDASTPAADDEEYVMKTSSNLADNKDSDGDGDGDYDRFPIRFDDLFASSPNFRGKALSDNPHHTTEEVDGNAVDTTEFIHQDITCDTQTSPLGNTEIVQHHPLTPSQELKFDPLNDINLDPNQLPITDDPPDGMTPDPIKPPNTDDPPDESPSRPLRSKNVRLANSRRNSLWSTELNRRTSLDMVEGVGGQTNQPPSLDNSGSQKSLLSSPMTRRCSSSAATVLHRNA